jgi:transcriptional regulator with XRE-family HTH domain
MLADDPVCTSPETYPTTGTSLPGERLENVRKPVARGVLPSAAPHTLSQALNAKIRELLQDEQMSQRELGRRLGVSQGAVSYLLAEKRRAAVLDYYERIARELFDTSLSVLIADLEHRVARGRDPVASSQGAMHGRPSAPEPKPPVFSREALLALTEGGTAAVVVRYLVEALVDAQRDARTEAARAARAELNAAVHQHARPKTRKQRSSKTPKDRGLDAAASPGEAGAADRAVGGGTPGGRVADARNRGTSG